MDCACTQGGGCDFDLTCVDGFCKNIDGATSSNDDGVDDGSAGDDQPGDGSGVGTDTMGGSTAAVDGGSSDDGIKLDVGDPSDVGSGPCTETGCRRIDMLFAIDSSLSMIEEVQALSATNSFNEIVAQLAAINCGDIEYRIGLTNDNDGGFIGSGAMGHPWFDSNEMTPAEIAAGFNAAASTVVTGGTPIACEHVLTSAVGLLEGDTTGFLRDDALLVLVLVTDVDDYGYYDQQGFGGPCDGFLCTQPVTPVEDLYDALVVLKNGEPEALAGIVVAGDPMVMEGSNLCGQPASCCGPPGGLECGQAMHAPRLYDFASMQVGSNGVTLDICEGAGELPGLLEDALGGDIDLACQAYEPEG